MKIKLLIQVGNANYGDIFEAIINPVNKVDAVFYDNSGLYNWLGQGQWEYVITNEKIDNNNSLQSLREMIGQDMSKVSFEFK